MRIQHTLKILTHGDGFRVTGHVKLLADDGSLYRDDRFRSQGMEKRRDAQAALDERLDNANREISEIEKKHLEEARQRGGQVLVATTPEVEKHVRAVEKVVAMIRAAAPEIRADLDVLIGEALEARVAAYTRSVAPKLEDAVDACLKALEFRLAAKGFKLPTYYNYSAGAKRLKAAFLGRKLSDYPDALGFCTIPEAILWCITGGPRLSTRGAPSGPPREQNYEHHVALFNTVMIFFETRKWLPRDMHKRLPIDWKAQEVLGLTEYFARMQFDIKSIIPDTRQIVTTVPEHVAAMMAGIEKMHHGRYVVYHALKWFAGIRTAELHRLSKVEEERYAAGEPSCINLDELQITLLLSKTGEPRVIPINPTLEAFLRGYWEYGKTLIVPKGAGRYTGRRLKGKGVNRTKGRGPGVQRIIVIDEGALPQSVQLEMQNISKKFKLARNVQRHCYGTYRYFVLRSYGDLSNEMGNSEGICKKHYQARGRTKKQAEDYWAIRPTVSAPAVSVAA